MDVRTGTPAFTLVDRLRLIWDRRRLASNRRRWEARVGFVGRRGTGGLRASRNTAARRCRAALRLRCWERCSPAVIVSTVPASRGPRRARARWRWAWLRAVVVARSRLSWTPESVALTPRPPGPDARSDEHTSTLQSRR